VTEPPREHDAVTLLGLPEAARQDHRVTKKMLAGQFEERSSADARLIAKAVASARLTGILRPETIRVPRYSDDERTVIDIPVIEAVLAAKKVTAADRARVAELIHRSMARPVVLIMHLPDGTALLSLALTHVSRTDPSRSTSVIDAHLMVPVPQIKPGTLDIEKLDRTDMWALYRDLVRVAAADGRPYRTGLQAADAIMLRRRLADLEAELASVIRDAMQAKSQQARIDFNTRARDLRAQVERTREVLYKP
jgi:hypothetical protein